MFVLSSISSNIEFWSGNHSLIYELNAFKKLKLLGEIFYLYCLIVWTIVLLYDSLVQTLNNSISIKNVGKSIWGSKNTLKNRWNLHALSVSTNNNQ